MSTGVVVVGPTAVCGPGVVDPEQATVALDCIDDDLALVDERVVPVDRLWQDVLAAALPERHDRVVLVCPSWWPTARVARVQDAARSQSANVEIIRRADVLASPPTTVSATVEVAQELIVVHTDARRYALVRSAGVVKQIATHVTTLDHVTVDVPSGAGLIGTEIARSLRSRGVLVTIADDRMVISATRARLDDGSNGARSGWRRTITPRSIVITGAALVATALVSMGVAARPSATVDADDVTWLIEGRVAAQIPASWIVERITVGSGSSRVQVVSPSGPVQAIQLTQSRVPVDETLEMTAAALRVAMADEVEGSFLDFTAQDQRAGREVVTYREVRDGLVSSGR